MTKESSLENILKEYLFLSKELLKFTDVESLQVFEDLVKQREVFIEKLKNCKYDVEYVKSDAGKELIEEIISIDKEVYDKMLKSRNMLKNQFEISNVYEGFVGEHITTGNRFDSKLH